MGRKRIMSLGITLTLLWGAVVFKTTASVQAETHVNYVQINGQVFELPNLYVDVEDLPTHFSQELMENLDAGYSETVYFPSRFSDEFLSYHERVAYRLELIGLSLNFLETLSEEQIEIIAKAEKAFVTHSYFQESDGYEDTYLVPISRAEFQNHMQNQITPTEIADYIFEQLQVGEQVDEHVGIDALSGLSTGWRTHGVGGGTLHLITTMFHLPTPNVVGRYVAVSEFLWTTMPRHRGTDFLALGRGSGMGALGNGDFRGFIQYREYRRRFTGGFNFVGQNSLGTTHHSRHLSNELSTINQGAGLRINQRRDILPPQLIGIGAVFVSSQFYGLNGGVSYTGMISSFSPGQVQTRTHYVSYMHQNGTVWLGSPSLSVNLTGPSLSITATPSASFAVPVQNNLSITWRS